MCASSTKARTATGRAETVKTDLDFARADTLYATHGLHPYAAKCPPPLARWAIERYTRPGEVVLDPMVGGGTTAVEARLTGRQAVAFDIDPLSCLLTRAKATPIDPARLEEARRSLLARLEGVSFEDGPLTDTEGPWPAIPNFERWFLPSVARALAFIKGAIAGLETGPAVRDLLWIVFSSLILSKNSVANARDIVHSRHHYREHGEAPDVAAVFRRRLNRAVRQMKDFYERCHISGETGLAVARADARSLPLDAESVALVFTSPPYYTALDYTRAHAFAVAWLADVLGVEAEGYRRLGRRYIGSERLGRPAHRPCLPPVAQAREVVERVEAQDPRRGQYLRAYLWDMWRALGEMARALAPGRHCVLVVCPSRVRRRLVPTHRLLALMAEALPGPRLELVGCVERTMDDRRRVMPYLQDRFGPRMRTEYVLVFRRP